MERFLQNDCILVNNFKYLPPLIGNIINSTITIMLYTNLKAFLKCYIPIGNIEYSDYETLALLITDQVIDIWFKYQITYDRAIIS